MIQYIFYDGGENKPSNSVIEQITALYRSQNWWEGPKNDQLIMRIITGSHCFVAASVNYREVVGMGRAISDRASDSYIQDVTVKKNFRGKGIGTRIIQMIVSRLHQDGIFWTGLIAEKGSHGFYKPLGFKPMPDSIPMIFSGS